MPKRSIAAVLAALALVPLVLASGLDRLAAQGAEVSGWPFASFGPGRLAAEARTALVRGEIDRALALARSAVAAGPMEATNSGLLGTIAALRGDRDLATRAFTVSAQLGWRDRTAQGFILAHAHAAGDAQVAAERLDALLRTGMPVDQAASTIRKVEALPGGPQALATRLSYSPSWAQPYVTRIADLSEDAFARRLAVIEGAMAVGFVRDCGPIGWAGDKLIQARRIAHAGTLWRRTGCGSADPTNFDAAARSFAEPGALEPGATSLRWQAISSGDAEVRIDSAPDASAGRALYVQADGAGSVLVARRIMTLLPGAYRLAWDAVDATGNPSAAFTLRLRCAHNGREISTAAPDGASITAVVPPSGCEGQRLEIVADPRRGARSGAWLTSIDLARAGTPSGSQPSLATP